MKLIVDMPSGVAVAGCPAGSSWLPRQRRRMAALQAILSILLGKLGTPS